MYKPRFLHSAIDYQALNKFCIDPRAITLSSSWGDSLKVGLVVKRFFDAVNPFPAQRLNNDFVPVYAGGAGCLLGYLDPEFDFDGLSACSQLRSSFGDSQVIIMGESGLGMKSDPPGLTP